MGSFPMMSCTEHAANVRISMQTAEFKARSEGFLANSNSGSSTNAQQNGLWASGQKKDSANSGGWFSGGSQAQHSGGASAGGGLWGKGSSNGVWSAINYVRKNFDS